MVMVIYDVPGSQERARVEACLYSYGFVRFFPNIMVAKDDVNTGLRLQLRRRMGTRAGRVAVVHFTPRAFREAQWILKREEF